MRFDPRAAGDNGEAALDAALAAADEAMLDAISSKLDLAAGMTQILSELKDGSLRGRAAAAAGEPETKPAGQGAAGNGSRPRRARFWARAARNAATAALAPRDAEAGGTIREAGAEAPALGPAAMHQSRAGVNVAELIREVNALDEAARDECWRAHSAADTAARSARAAEQSAAAAQQAARAYRTLQAEHPRRRAPLLRQAILAFGTVMLVGVACYFAAQALGASANETFVWAGLFVAILAGGAVALDSYKDRSKRIWRVLIILIGAFILLLGILRFWFLMTVGAGGVVSAIIGAVLFTAATAGFLCLGYRALRAAETPQAWRARRRARAAWRAARRDQDVADRDAAERDRLANERDRLANERDRSRADFDIVHFRRQSSETGHGRRLGSMFILIGIPVAVLGIVSVSVLRGFGASIAVANGCLLLVAAASFLSQALRAAETPQAWRARQRVRAAWRAASRDQDAADRDAAERDRLTDAYLVHVRRLVLKTCPAEQQLAMESAVREHLSGGCPID
jgi:hypothetical protein